MVPEYMAVVAFLKLAVLAAAGFFGLRMCRLTLRSKTALDLRREAVTSMLRQESYCCLTSHQRAAVFIALSACGEAREGSNHAALSHGFQSKKFELGDDVGRGPRLRGIGPTSTPFVR